MSLITGALRSRNLLLSAPAASPCSSSVVLRNQTRTLAGAHSAGTSSALPLSNPHRGADPRSRPSLPLVAFLSSASFLAERSWRGLEQKLGETPVVRAAEGRRGIAIAYEEEGAAS